MPQCEFTIYSSDPAIALLDGCTIELVAKGQGPTGLYTHHSRIIVSRFRWLIGGPS
jgi:hypothetical protein